MLKVQKTTGSFCHVKCHGFASRLTESEIVEIEIRLRDEAAD
jgi:hypothetical protein